MKSLVLLTLILGSTIFNAGSAKAITGRFTCDVDLYVDGDSGPDAVRAVKILSGESRRVTFYEGTYHDESGWDVKCNWARITADGSFTVIDHFCVSKGDGDIYTGLAMYQNDLGPRSTIKGTLENCVE